MPEAPGESITLDAYTVCHMRWQDDCRLLAEVLELLKKQRVRGPASRRTGLTDR